MVEKRKLENNIPRKLEGDWFQRCADLLYGLYEKDYIDTEMNKLREFHNEIKNEPELWPKGEVDFKRFVLNKIICPALEKKYKNRD